MIQIIYLLFIVSFAIADETEQHKMNLRQKIHERHNPLRPERNQKPENPEEHLHSINIDELPEERKAKIREDISSRRMKIDEYRRNIELKKVDRRMKLDEFNMKNNEELENRQPLKHSDLHLKEENERVKFRRDPLRHHDRRPRTFVKDGVRVQEKVEV